MYSLSTLLLTMPGGTEWVLIILAVLILFGGRKIPEFMRGLGRGIREFNDAKTNVRKEIEEGMSEKEVKEAREKNTSSIEAAANCCFRLAGVSNARMLPSTMIEILLQYSASSI